MEKMCGNCGVPRKTGGRCGRHCDKFYSGWEPKASEVLGDLIADLDSRISDLSNEILPTETPLTDTQKRITEICDEVKNILLEKNRKYGDSAINPKRVFSKASPIEQINVRLDDKLSRIMSAQDDDTEDAELDLIGYLILKRVAKSFTEGE